MTGRKSFDELRIGIDTDPVRRTRVDEIKRAMRDVLALSKLREERGLTQRELAALMHVTQANVSRVEHQEDLYVSTLRGYIEALGGRLEIRAVFENEVIAFQASADRVAAVVDEEPPRASGGSRALDDVPSSKRRHRRVRLVA